MSSSLRRTGLNSAVVSPIGLDIGAKTVRAAQLERAGDRWKVLRLAGWSRREEEIGTDASEGFAKRVRRSLRQAEYQGRRVTAGLSVPEVEVHPLDVADRGDMESEGRFAQDVRWELERVMGIPADSAATAYWRLPPSAATRTTAIGVAARESQVKAIATLAESMGLDCNRVDATPCAVARLGAVLRRRPCRHSERSEESQSEASPAVWGVLDVGHRRLRLVVSIGEHPVLVRTLGNGGQAWTESVAAALGLSADAAETHKRDHGIAGSPSPSLRHSERSKESPAPLLRAEMLRFAQHDSGSSSEIAGMILNILRADLERAVAEIERSYEYVMRCYPQHRADELLLVGGGADMKGLDNYLAEKLGVQVNRLDDVVQLPGTPLLASDTIRERVGPYACAIGLAIEPEASP